MTRDEALALADRILALINSKPQTPTKADIEAILSALPPRLVSGTLEADPAGFLLRYFTSLGVQDPESLIAKPKDRADSLGAATNAFFDAVNAHYEHMHASTPEAIAKAKDLARKDEDARNWTRDRDWGATGLTMGMPGAPPIHDLKGTYAVCLPIQPRWALYMQEARQALQAADEAKPQLAEGMRRILTAFAPIPQSDGPPMVYYEVERPAFHGKDVERFQYQSCRWSSPDLDRLMHRVAEFVGFLSANQYSVVWRLRPELRFYEDAREYWFSCRLHTLPNDSLTEWATAEGLIIPQV